MKRLLLIVLPLLLIVGCEDTTEPVNPLIGVYNMTRISFVIYSSPDETYTFNHDGSNTYMVMILGDDDVYSFQGKLDGDVVSEGGTWSDTGNKITFIPSDGDSEIGDYWVSGRILDYTLSGNNLHMEISYPSDGIDSYGHTISYDFTKE